MTYRPWLTTFAPIFANFSRSVVSDQYSTSIGNPKRMREWEIGAVKNINCALPYIRFAPNLALVGVGVNRIGKDC